MAKGRILLIGNLGPTSGTGQYTHSLYDQLKLLESGDTTFRMVSFYSPTMEKLFFDLAEMGLAPIMPLQSGLSLASHLVHLPRLRGSYSLFHITDGALGIVAKFKHPVVATVHDIIPFLNFRRRASAIADLAMRHSMRSIFHANAIIVDSYHTKGDLSRRFEIDPSRIKVIPMGVDHQLFRPIEKSRSRTHFGLPPSKKILLNVGNEEPRKNVVTLIRAFIKVARNVPDSILVRVGGRESKEVADLIASNDLSDRVRYYKLSRGDMPFIYCAADAVILPSWYEGFGLPALEAMACGCPVIASDATSIPEVVGEGGILIDPMDCEAFASAIENLLVSTSLQSDLARRGLEQSEKFSWATTAEKTFQVYRETLSGNFNG
jgi:glycosyltransferase involved in cell wall biosynthesis